MTDQYVPKLRFLEDMRIKGRGHRLSEQGGGLLFKASSKTLLTIAADPKRLGVRVGMTSVLHTWGSALTHHPHVHVIAPGGGLSADGKRWISCRPGYFLPVKALSKLFRRMFIEVLARLHKAGKLRFLGDLAKLADPDAFTAYLAPLRKTNWVVYAKPPFGGPKTVLAYLSRYTHRVASRTIASSAPMPTPWRSDGKTIGSKRETA